MSARLGTGGKKGNRKEGGDGKNEAENTFHDATRTV
jgi:hypothetical protein